MIQPARLSADVIQDAVTGNENDGKGDSEFAALSNIPLKERLSSKNWQNRVSAYKELTETFRNSKTSDVDAGI